MKILLLSDIPPCDNITSGLVLSALLRFIPRYQICCFVVVNPNLKFTLNPEFANIPIACNCKPNENWSWLPQGRLLRKLSSGAVFAGEYLTEKKVVRCLISKAVAFGRDQKVDRVWAVLQGQTTICMAKAVADKLGVPLHTHIWDPFSWWAKANRLDGWTTRHIQRLFDGAISHSHCVATASEPMAQMYRERFNVEVLPVIASHSGAIAQKPDPTMDKEDRYPILIGMAGQFYAAAEWLQLLHALRSSHWRIAGRSVRVIIMGPQEPPGGPEENIDYLGWKSQPEAAFILSQCDILYCPYPFDASMAEVSKYSFPSKLVLYLAAGRPIVFHGPTYSAPARYVEDKQCGIIADRPLASVIYNQLERLVRVSQSYKTICLNAQAAFISDFTLASMHRAFNKFIGYPEPSDDSAGKPQDHTVPGGISNSTLKLFEKECKGSVVRRIRSALKARDTYVRHPTKLIRKLSRDSIRRLVLVVPKLRNMYYEIQWYQAEQQKLRQKITEEVYLSNKKHPSTKAKSKARAERQEVITQGLLPAAQDIGYLYPDSKILVVTQSLRNLTRLPNAAISEVRLESDDFTFPIWVDAIGYIRLRGEKNKELNTDNDWDTVNRFLPQKQLGSLLRFALEEKFDRFVVSHNDKDAMALLCAVSRLSSKRLTVMLHAKASTPGEKWLVSHDHIEYRKISS